MITMNFVRESKSCLHYCSLCDMIFHSVFSRIPCDQGASRNMLWKIHWGIKIVKGLSFVKAWGNRRKRLQKQRYLLKREYIQRECCKSNSTWSAPMGMMLEPKMHSDNFVQKNEKARKSYANYCKCFRYCPLKEYCLVGSKGDICKYSKCLRYCPVDE